MGKDVKISRELSDADLAALGGFKDALKVLKDTFGQVATSTELGDGFTLLKDKDELVGKPMLIVKHAVRDSDKWVGATFSVCHTIYIDKFGNDRKVVFVDGGSGVHRQLMEQRQASDGQFFGMVVPNGLVRSEYTVEGSEDSAVTYWLDTTPAA